MAPVMRRSTHPLTARCYRLHQRGLSVRSVDPTLPRVGALLSLTGWSFKYYCAPYCEALGCL